MAAGNILRNIAKRLQQLSFLRQSALLMLLGAVGALALPPFGAWWLLPLVLPPLALLAHASASPKRAFILGWCWGFGHFVVGLYWIANALLVEPEKFAWLVPFAVSLIPSALAAYIGIFALTLRAVKCHGVCQMVLASALWVGLEVLRAHLFTGFPWNLIGYSWVSLDAVLQLASIAGIYGLSLLAVLIGFLPLAVFDTRRKAVAAASFIAILFIATYVFGAVRLQKADEDIKENTAQAVAVRIVQGNISQHYKWDPETRRSSLMKHLTLSREGGFLAPKGKKQILVWPESAVSYALNQDVLLQTELREALPEGTVLVTGGLRMTEEGESFQVWNSIYALSRHGIEDVYDKVHLVPFGEYVPLRRWLPFVQKITFGGVDFSAGPTPKNIVLPPGLPTISPLICYEVIFPQGSMADTPPASIIINVTNDAWFGESTGPYQHLAMARVRAVERGIPLARAANTGVSVLIDRYGRVQSHLPLNSEGVIDATIQLKNNK